MSCIYTINGKQYSDSEVKQVFSSILAVPGNENLSNEELVAKITELSKDRFVDVNLFSPYQESAYTNIIFSEVVDQLGVLKPKMEIKQSAGKVFGDTYSRFKNEAAKFNAISEKITSEEAYNQFKQVEGVAAKFPEIAALNYNQFKSMVDQFNHIVNEENWKKFTQLAEQKLRQLGLTIKDGNIVEKKFDATEIAKRLEEDQNDENEPEYEDSEREINESYEDGRAFRLSPKDTASYRVKLFLSTIPNYERNIFGKKDFVSMDQVFEDLLQTAATLPVVNYKTFTEALLSKAEGKPYLHNVVGKLDRLQKDGNVKLRNEIITVFNKAFTDHVLVLWNPSEGGVKVKVISSNRNSIIRQIKQDWIEAQKRSAIISTDTIGDLVINKEKVKELYDSLKEANKSKDITDKKAWVAEFFKSVGIDFDAKMIDALVKSANNGFFKYVRSANFAAMFRPNGVFDNIMKTYSKEGDGKSDNRYEDSNNAMIHERAFDYLAQIFFDFNGNKYQTGTFQNGENKTIYSYIQPSYLETVKKKLNNGDGYLKRLSEASFSKSSEVVAQLLNNLTENSNNFVYRIRYADSLKNDTAEKAGVVRKRMSRKEMLFDSLVKYMNSGKNTGLYNMFTLSDKTVTPVIEMTKTKLDPTFDILLRPSKNTTVRTSFDFKDGFADKLYTLAKSEIDRMVDYANNANKAGLGINNFDKSSQIFYLFPALNNKEDADLKSIVDSIQAGNQPSLADENYIKKVLVDVFKNDVMKSFRTLTDIGLIKKSEALDENDKKTILLNYDQLDKDYLAQYSNLTDKQKGVMIISEFKYNNLKAQINSLQVLGADPALFYKTKIGKAKEALTTSDVNSIVKTTMDEFSKRAAMFIAPGAQGTFEWTDLNGRPVDRTNYDIVTIKDVVKNVGGFEKVNIADAQELVTLQEHIDRLMSEGRIDLEDWQSITDKIEKNKGKFYELSDKEKQIALQPAKPVYSSNTFVDGFSRIDYIKSSTYPMIPEVIQGTELDKVRAWMENNNISSAPFESAKKTGIPAAPLELFDANDNFVEPTKERLAEVRQTLNREGLRTQQEIPAQKDEINVVSQMDRQLFEGLLGIKGFMFDAHSYTGSELKKLSEAIRIAFFYKNQQVLADRLNIKITDNNVVFKDQKALADLLKEEALDRDFSANDIKAIQTNEDGNLVIPIYLMAKGKRFEGLVTSIFSKLVKLKVPGTSLVQVSGVGTKVKESELTDKVKNQIIYTDAYDASKGLQYIRKEATTVDDKGNVKKGKAVQPAQVFVSQYLKDKEGNLIDLTKYVKKDAQGRMILDSNKIDKDLLQFIGARIPNQGHSSMLPIEVAGFLPSFMENTVVVPDGVTSQMGSDFDVDKLYSYISSIENVTDDKISSQKFDSSIYKNDYESLMSASEAELLQMYKEIHWSVLTHPDVFDKITRSTEFPDISKEIEVFEKAGLLEDKVSALPMDFEAQIKTFLDNRSGKSGTGIFAQMISFLAEHQDKDIKLKSFLDNNDNPIQESVKFLKDNGEILKLFRFTAEGRSETENGERSKTDNTSIFLSESVDNAKNKNLDKFNLTVEAMNAVRAVIGLSSETGEIADIRYVTRLMPQPIIKNYLNEIELSRDSFSDKYTNKFDIATKMINTYNSYLSDVAEIDIDQRLFSPATLLKALIDGKDFGEKLINDAKNGVLLNSQQQAQLNEYINNQVSILKLYTQLDNIGWAMGKLMTGTNVTTAGIGSTLFAVADKLRQVKTVALNTVFQNTEQLLGDIAYDGTIINPTSQAGHAMNVALSFGRDVLSKLAPIHFGASFDQLRDKVVRERFKDSNISNWGKTKYMELSEDLMKSAYAYLLTNPELGMVQDTQNDRTRLLYGANGERSLGERIIALKEQLKDTNYFINRLQVTAPINKAADPYLVKYRSPFSQDIDEQANNKGFLELILSGDKNQIDIARDLVTYAYLTGYDQGSSSYLKFIPVEYLMLNQKFTNGLKDFASTFDDMGTFYKQFIQNNPDRALNMGKKLFEDVFFKKIDSDDVIHIADDKLADALLVQMPKEEGNGYKYADYIKGIKYVGDQRRVYLFERVVGSREDDSRSYRRIPTLGNGTISEYVYDSEDVKSIFFNNLTPTQKMDTLSTNPENPFRKIKIYNAQYFDLRYLIPMGDTATQFIGLDISNASKTTKTALEAYKDKSNTGEYAPTDKVIISGNTLLQTVKPKEGTTKLDVSDINSAYSILESVFNDHYAPMIDKAIKAGADFMVGSLTGMEEVAKKYLRNEGLAEDTDDKGVTTFKNPKSSEKIEAQPTEINDSDVPTISLFGIGGEQTASEEESAGAFGFEFANDDVAPQEATHMITEGVEKAGPVQTDADIVNNYTNDPSKPSTLKSVLSKVGTNTDNEFYKTLVSVFRKAGFPDINVSFSEAINNPGEYNSINGSIIINPALAISDNTRLNRQQNLESTIIHEALHAYISDILSKISSNDKSLTEAQRVFGTALKQLYKTTVEKVMDDPQHSDRLVATNNMIKEKGYISTEDKSMYYGLTSVDEFASMLFTNPTFQQFMNTTIVQETGKLSVIDRFKALLAKLLKSLAKSLNIVTEGSALEQGVNDLFNLISVSQEKAGGETSAKNQLSLFSMSTRQMENYTLENQCK